MKPIEHLAELKMHELTSQLELLKEILIKIENQLTNCLDLQFLTAESALKIMYNHFLSLQSELLNLKHKTMLNLFEMERELKL